MHYSIKEFLNDVQKLNGDFKNGEIETLDFCNNYSKLFQKFTGQYAGYNPKDNKDVLSLYLSSREQITQLLNDVLELIVN